MTPKASACLLHPPLLFPDLLLRLPSRIAPAIDIHPVASLPSELLLLIVLLIVLLMALLIILLDFRVRAQRPLHQPRRSPFSQLVDSPNGINS